MESINPINSRLADNAKPHEKSLVQPHVMSANDSFIVTDSKEMSLEETAKILRQNGYSVKTINLSETGDFYNPSDYIHEGTNR